MSLLKNIISIISHSNHHVITMDIFFHGSKKQPVLSRFSAWNSEKFHVQSRSWHTVGLRDLPPAASCQLPAASCHGMSKVKQICKWYTQYDENDETHKFKWKLNLIYIYIIQYLHTVMCMIIPPCLRYPKFPTSSLTVASTDGTSCPTGQIGIEMHRRQSHATGTRPLAIFGTSSCLKCSSPSFRSSLDATWCNCAQ